MNNPNQPAGLRKTVAPTWPAITLEGQQLHSRNDVPEDLPSLQTYVEVATEYAEKEQGRCLRQATWRAAYDCWPSSGILRLPMPPLVSVSSITYYDTAETQQTLATTYYTVDIYSEPGRIEFDSPPSIDDRPGGILITFVAGYSSAAAIPATTRQAIRVLAQTLFENREALVGGAINHVPFSVTDMLNQNKLLSYV